MPTWARPSSHVTSRLQRFMTSLTICSAVWVGSVEHMAVGGRVPDGSRFSTQRRGKGSEPERDHNAVPVQISNVRSPSPSQSRGRFCQAVCEARTTRSSAGRSVPTRRGRPLVCRVCSGGGSGSTASRRPVVTSVTCGCRACRPRSSTREAVSPISVMERRGEPSTDQADHLMRPHPHGLLSRAQPFTPVRSGCQHTHERQRPPLCCPGERRHHRHHDPSQSRTPYRPLSAGESTLTVMASRADRATPAPFQRVIDHEIHAGSGWHNGLDDQHEHLATHRERRPLCSVTDLMEATPGGCPVEAFGTQSCCTGAASLRQQRSGSHRHPFSPCRSRTPWSKNRQNVSNGVGKGHEHPPG
jgi:hypothetical protein